MSYKEVDTSSLSEKIDNYAVSSSLCLVEVTSPTPASVSEGNEVRLWRRRLHSHVHGSGVHSSQDGESI